MSEPIPKFVGAEEFAALLNVPVTWIREQTRSRARDPIPHFKMGRYTRFDLSDPRLAEWLERRRKASPPPPKKPPLKFMATKRQTEAAE